MNRLIRYFVRGIRYHKSQLKKFAREIINCALEVNCFVGRCEGLFGEERVVAVRLGAVSKHFAASRWARNYTTIHM
jgi:hypothetical protein